MGPGIGRRRRYTSDDLVAGPLLAASLVCARATARFLRTQQASSVGLVVTGTWADRDGDEDHACADLIEALLQGEDPPRAAYEQRVRRSDFGRRFAAGREPHLPPADLDCCAQADRFDFAMQVRRLDGGVSILRRDMVSRASARPS